MEIKNIYVCSPLSAKSKEGIKYNMLLAQSHMAFLESHGLKGKAPHAYLPLLLDDDIPEERALALNFGLELLKLCNALCIFGDRISKGMWGEISYAKENGIPIYCQCEEVHESLWKRGICANTMEGLFAYGND